VVLVSDTHLSRRAPQAQQNWDAVLRYVEETAPDAVIHIGDLSLDGAHESEDLRHAHQQLRHLHVAWHAVPGNHDIGDNPFPGAPGGSTVTAARLQRWLDVVGADLASAPPYRFVPPAGRRRLAGLFAGRPLRLVISGHVHQHRLLRLDGTDHLWVPSTWAVLPDRVQPVFGTKECGIVTLELGSGGAPERESSRLAASAS
jgi:predicted phosphodiesterase